jgi:hypothetical protein
MHHGHAGAATTFCDPAVVERGGAMAELERAAEVRNAPFFGAVFPNENELFTKTGSGQT